MAENSNLYMCLACGGVANAGERRVLESDASKHLIPVWKELLFFSIKKICDTVNEGHVKDVLSNKPKVLCRKCYNSMKSYYQKQCELLKNMNRVVEQLNLASSQLSADSTTVSTGQKRGATDAGVQSSPKRPRLSVSRHNLFSADVQSSPTVSVSINIQ